MNSLGGLGEEGVPEGELPGGVGEEGMVKRKCVHGQRVHCYFCMISYLIFTIILLNMCTQYCSS